MNALAKKYLKYSGYRWDPSAFFAMRGEFEAASVAEREEFAREACAIPLRQYEQTIYWGILSGIIVARDQRCMDCGRKRRLVVHHKTYEHRGEEHFNLHDLIGLCWHCHARKHPHLTESQRSQLLGFLSGDEERVEAAIRAGSPLESVYEITSRSMDELLGKGIKR